MPSSVAKTPRPAAREILTPGQIFCPVGRALDVIGDRWTLVLVRHLLGGPLGFQELRARSGIAPRVLAQRLRTLVKRGFVTRSDATRPRYAVSERGRSLEPVIAATARWYLRQGLDHLQVDANRFSATSAQSVLEALPFLLREERAAGVHLTFEVRLSGLGGGVWTVHIADGACTVREGFAQRADVRYTADARVWCGVALGIADAKAVVRDGLMSKDGGREALDYYFHQIARTPARSPSATARPARGGARPERPTPAARPRRRRVVSLRRSE
jgi:DNA-binding HxlR family transcriptional regulator